MVDIKEVLEAMDHCQHELPPTDNPDAPVKIWDSVVIS